MSERPKAQSRKKKPFPVKAVVIGMVTVLAAAGAGAGFYVYMGRQYETVFFPHTVINGFDASNKTAEEVKDLIAAGIEGYTLTIYERGGNTEQITGEEINLHSVFDGSLEEYLEAQEPMRWWQAEGTEYEISTMIDYDEELLEEKIDGLSCFSDENSVEPKDAYLSEYEPGKGFQVVPEEPGTILVRDIVAEGIVDAISGLKPDLNLEELDAYKKAEITQENEALQARAEELNRYVNMTVTYLFGDEREVLDGDTIAQWMSIGEDGQVSFQAEAVASYVKGLASKYDTAYQEKKLKTSYGPTVTISRGFYGWRMDQGKEAEALYSVLMSGENQNREPIYIQTANSHGANDYGNTYVEINLTAQHLFFYKDGNLVVESDFVSGNHAKGYDTPSGAYPLTYKQRDAVLKGATYRTPVKYWMPFNGNIGMHDANWRSSFGGKIYMTNGSHGCVNLPPSVAKIIFENISQGMPVLCYHLDGTDNKQTSSSKQGSTGQAGAALPAQPAVPAASAPAPPAQPESGVESQPGPSAENPAEAGNPSQESSAAPPAESSQVQETNPGPGAPGSDPGAVPQETGPADPGNGGPVGPGSSDPGNPGGTGSGGPGDPGSSDPGNPGSTGSAEPGGPGSSDPGNSGGAGGGDPGNPGSSDPGNPGGTGGGDPGNPGSSDPGNPGGAGTSGL